MSGRTIAKKNARIIINDKLLVFNSQRTKADNYVGEIDFLTDSTALKHAVVFWFQLD